MSWYEKALRGKYASEVGSTVLQKIADEITVEFPTTDNEEFVAFCTKRGYRALSNSIWL